MSDGQVYLLFLGGVTAMLFVLCGFCAWLEDRHVP